MTKNILVSLNTFTLIAAKVHKYKKRWKVAEKRALLVAEEAQRFFKLKEDAESQACNFNVKVLELEKENKKLHGMLEEAASQRVTLERKLDQVSASKSKRNSLLRTITKLAFLEYARNEADTFLLRVRDVLREDGWEVVNNGTDEGVVFEPAE